ncbi:hypothetical protein chiPu_0019583 [Chiloscyllium punctatum]|uniref:Ig-like domain-containing protein n=1 Tax=Chiloscyllium punctatum TaxID=137246 RepID=A0A401RSL0_CHIPU|nr:hypothetical protein [Chiloscyllium punctatum]
MIMSTIFLSLLVTFFSCIQSEVILTQPEAESGRHGGTQKLTCETSDIDLGNSYMYWFRQVPGQSLEWLLHYYSSSSNDYAPAITDRFIATKDTSKNIFALNMKSLKIEDTAIYYCARDSMFTSPNLLTCIRSVGYDGPLLYEPLQRM